MDERAILARIDQLVAQEHELRTAIQRGTIDSDAEQARLRAVEETLDQCWDLLRRRRAARAGGQDPDAVAARPVAEVEGYLQ
jgi:hypothetical protein